MTNLLVYVSPSAPFPGGRKRAQMAFELKSLGFEVVTALSEVRSEPVGHALSSWFFLGSICVFFLIILSFRVDFTAFWIR